MAPYATFGTKALAQNVRRTMGKEYRAVLMANHGLVAVGADLPKALDIAEHVEFVARIFCQAQTMGQPVVLSDGEMERVMEKFQTYGRQDIERQE